MAGLVQLNHRWIADEKCSAIVRLKENKDYFISKFLCRVTRLFFADVYEQHFSQPMTDVMQFFTVPVIPMFSLQRQRPPVQFCNELLAGGQRARPLAWIAQIRPLSVRSVTPRGAARRNGEGEWRRGERKKERKKKKRRSNVGAYRKRACASLKELSELRGGGSPGGGAPSGVARESTTRAGVKPGGGW